MAKKTKNNRLITVKEHIKNNTISPVYLFYGEETFIKDTYLPKIKALGYDGSFPDFNDLKITDSTPLSDIDAMFESYPVMSDKKFIYIKDSGIFSKRCPSEKSEFWVEKLTDIPDFLFIIFDEKDVSGTSSVYKALIKVGTALNFEHWETHEILSWIQRGFIKAGKKIDKSTAEYLISICNPGLGEIKNEMDKLINYCGNEIYKSDVDAVVSKSLDAQIFDITDNIISGNLSSSLSTLSNFRAQDLEPLEIFSLIFGSFNRMLRVLLMMSEGANYESVAAKLYPSKNPSSMIFLIKKYEQRAKAFGEKFLTKQVINAAELIYSTRTGTMNSWLVLENYITECIYAKKSN